MDIFQNALSYVVIDIREGEARADAFALDSQLLPYRFQNRTQTDLSYAFSVTPMGVTEGVSDPPSETEEVIPENLEQDLAEALIEQSGSFDLPLSVTPEDQSAELDRLESILLNIKSAMQRGRACLKRQMS